VRARLRVRSGSEGQIKTKVLAGDYSLAEKVVGTLSAQVGGASVPALLRDCCRCRWAPAAASS
jgi:hypothetical protein